ncbi:hypothetical protein R1sor_024340 [Riccia sorocarpa]|uniref:Replitron HUH endonuclease domain-containing protein n=1 Tax=Riccia sorocarpa TaxID=122646 RepID=A0ABD3GU85_9MARC
MIGQIGTDIDPQVFEQMARFVDEHADMGMIAVERGVSQLQLHIQGMLCLKSSSVRSLKDDIKTAISWQENAEAGASMCIKSLKQKGLHTVLGMVGYCHKDENELHYRAFHKNISDEQIEVGKKHYVIHGACAYKTKGCLRQMLQSAEQKEVKLEATDNDQDEQADLDKDDTRPQQTPALDLNVPAAETQNREDTMTKPDHEETGSSEKNNAPKYISTAEPQKQETMVPVVDTNEYNEVEAQALLGAGYALAYRTEASRKKGHTGKLPDFIPLVTSRS